MLTRKNVIPAQAGAGMTGWRNFGIKEENQVQKEER